MEAGHHSGYSVWVGQHEAHAHFVKLWVPESQDGRTACTMASLVVMVVNEDQGVPIGHEAPAFSPVSLDKTEEKNK